MSWSSGSTCERMKQHHVADLANMQVRWGRLLRGSAPLSDRASGPDAGLVGCVATASLSAALPVKFLAQGGDGNSLARERAEALDPGPGEGAGGVSVSGPLPR